MKPPKYQQAAAIIRNQITSGQLPPGASAPSGAALARETGYSVLTCRRALRALTEDGTLVPGASRHARPRVPGASRHDQTVTDARRELSAALASRRRAAGLTQPELAEITGVSVTRVAHAEAGRLWQSRRFWELMDEALKAGGELLSRHDVYRAAEVPPDPEPAAAPATAAAADRDPLTLSATVLPAGHTYATRWLALEVLMSDEAVGADGELLAKLLALQAKWQTQALARPRVTAASRVRKPLPQEGSSPKR